MKFYTVSYIYWSDYEVDSHWLNREKAEARADALNVESSKYIKWEVSEEETQD